MTKVGRYNRRGFMAVVLLAIIAAAVLIVGPIDRPVPRYGDPARAASLPGDRVPVDAGQTDSDWPSFGRDPGGSQSSPLAQITGANVGALRKVWEHHSGDFIVGGASPSAVEGGTPAGTRLEVTPIIVGDALYYCTPFGRVFSLDAATGHERWSYDPFHAAGGRKPVTGEAMKPGHCRGVAYWRDVSAPAASACATRIYRSGRDSAVFAMDAQTGRPCEDFGASAGHPGYITHKDFENHGEGLFTASSPPIVVDGVLIAAINANDTIANAADGIVRGFDARSGRLIWAFDPIPADKRDVTGAANVWTLLSADPARHLVFLATTSPSTDYYGGGRSFDIPLASSVVAVSTRTGAVAWHYQIVRHDLWDYDLPSTPQAVTIRKDGRLRDVVIEQTKMGTVFVLDRDTGKPVFPVTEERAPPSHIAGEHAAPSQLLPVLPEAFARRRMTGDDVFGLTRIDRGWCRRRLAQLRNDGPYTPPDARGSLFFPSALGGGNWGGSAYDPATNLLIVKAENLATIMRMTPTAKGRLTKTDYLTHPLKGTPYQVDGSVFLSPIGLPCTRPPWGTVSAIDMSSGRIVWQVPLGQSHRFGITVPAGLHWGSPNIGGPLVTRGGLVFIGASLDSRFRALDIRTGREMWASDLPAPGMAVPATYAVGGRQYVVIAAGGNSLAETKIGDAIMAFALPR